MADDDDRDDDDRKEPHLCMFCGAYSPRKCDLIDDAGFCAWEELEDGQ